MIDKPPAGLAERVIERLNTERLNTERPYPCACGKTFRSERGLGRAIENGPASLTRTASHAGQSIAANRSSLGSAVSKCPMHGRISENLDG